MVIWLIGISGSGKTTIGKALYNKLRKKIKNIVYIDGDQFRDLMNNDLGYSIKDRDKNAKRLIKFIKFLSDQKIYVVCAANLTKKKHQNLARKTLQYNYFEIFIRTSIETLIKERDYKGLYKKALQKKIKNVVGIDIKYIKPKNSDLIIDNEIKKKDFSKILNKIIKKTNILKKI